MKKKLEDDGNKKELANLQSIIDELNEKMADMVKKDVHESLQKENAELKNTVESLQNQVIQMNQTINGMK